jgi:hypothetical protein
MRINTLKIILWTLISLSTIFVLIYIIFYFLNQGTVVPASWAISAGMRQGLFSFVNENKNG